MRQRSGRRRGDPPPPRQSRPEKAPLSLSDAAPRIGTTTGVGAPSPTAAPLSGLAPALGGTGGLVDSGFARWWSTPPAIPARWPAWCCWNPPARSSSRCRPTPGSTTPSAARPRCSPRCPGSGWPGRRSAAASPLPAAARDQERVIAVSTDELRAERDEWSQLPTVFRQAQALTDFSARPLVVVTAGKGQDAGWPAAQDNFAAVSTNSAHRTIGGTTYEALLDDETFAAASTHGVADVVAAVRDGGPVQP